MQSQLLKELKQSLKELNCPRSIHELYFFLRGVIAGTQVADPSVWFGWLFDGKVLPTMIAHCTTEQEMIDK